MAEILSLITVGIALSMDAFSVALGVGTLTKDKKKCIQISCCVGIFHFFMPLLGIIIGTQIILALYIKTQILMTGIFLLIAFEMIKSALNNEKISIKLNPIGIIGFALTVSIDSFSTGIGLGAFTNNIFLAATIFSITSFIFTYIGLLIGRYSKEKLGKIASIFGALLLITLAIIHFM